MTNRKPWLVMPVLALGLIIACGDGDGPDPGGGIPPELLPDAARWSVWNSSEKAILDYSIADDGTVTVTVGGTAESNDETKGWNAWRISADYAYTGKKDTCYEYKFEAWTQSGTRDLHVQYYADNDEGVWLTYKVPITNTRTTHTVYGYLLKSGKRNLSFQLADQLGTVNLKMLEIKEHKIGKLTITNFSSSDIPQGAGVWGGDDDGSFLFVLGFQDGDGTIWPMSVNGNTIILPVWEEKNNSYVPYTGNTTLEGGKLEIYFYEQEMHYKNTVAIKFTNGNATINFGTQMMKKNN